MQCCYCIIVNLQWYCGSIVKVNNNFLSSHTNIWVFLSPSFTFSSSLTLALSMWLCPHSLSRSRLAIGAAWAILHGVPRGACGSWRGHAWRLAWWGRFWFWVGSDGVLIGRRRLGGFRWSFNQHGFCGDRSFDQCIWRLGFDCMGFILMGFWSSGFRRFMEIGFWSAWASFWWSFDRVGSVEIGFWLRGCRNKGFVGFLI